MPLSIPFGDLKSYAGKEIGTSAWLEVGQARINAFADVTGDRQWIHVDEERARSGPFGQTIAHGYLTLALIPGFMDEIVVYQGIGRSINYGADRLRFLTPVRPTDRVRGRLSFREVSDFRDGALKIKTRSTVEVEGAFRPACVVDGISILHPAETG